MNLPSLEKYKKLKRNCREDLTEVHSFQERRVSFGILVLVCEVERLVEAENWDSAVVEKDTVESPPCQLTILKNTVMYYNKSIHGCQIYNCKWNHAFLLIMSTTLFVSTTILLFQTALGLIRKKKSLKIFLIWLITSKVKLWLNKMLQECIWYFVIFYMQEI